MRKVLTADDNCNNHFYQDEAHKIESDEHRQEVVFDKGGFATGLPKTTTSPTINPHARQSQRNRLKRLTSIFLRQRRQRHCMPTWRTTQVQVREVQVAITVARYVKYQRFKPTPLACAHTG